jgi:drug/metabolite transporter (DMT)-like permease
VNYPNFREHIALLAVSVIYGVNFVIAKEVMPAYILPDGFILLRVVSATVFFFLLANFVTDEKIRKKDWLRLFFCGLTGVALNQLLFFKGLNLTTPINASLVMITTPISVLLLDRFLNRDRITFLKSIGILAGAAGALLIIFGKKDFALQKTAALGDFLVFLNAFFYAVYLVIVKPLMKNYHPITVIKWVFAFGLVVVLPAGWNEVHAVEWQNFSLRIWLCVIFVLLFTTILAYLLNIYAMKKVSPAMVGVYIYVQPLVATVIAVMFAKDVLTWSKIVAAILIFGGVYLTGKSQKKTSKVLVPESDNST